MFVRILSLEFRMCGYLYKKFSTVNNSQIIEFIFRHSVITRIEFNVEDKFR